MGSCTPNCLQTCEPLQTVWPGEIVSPIVTINFTINGESITVGNNSSPSFHNATAIKSFEYGLSDGISVEVMIVDQEGGAFKLFVDSATKCPSNASDQLGDMNFTFGWILANCDGTSSPKISTPCYANIIEIETTYEAGRFYFKLKGKDTTALLFAVRKNTIIGTKKTPVSVQNAIQQLFQNTNPSVQVEFVDADFKPTTIQSVIGTNTNAVYDCGNQNPMAVANRWKSLFVSPNGNGFTPIWTGTNQAKISFVENTTNSQCNLSVDCGDNNIGTFIVNGGNCTNVISFTPKFNLTTPLYGFGVGGGTSGGISGQSIQYKNPCNLQPNQTGASQNVTTSRQAQTIYGKNMNNIVTAIGKNSLADSGFIKNMKAIDADLVVQGMPQFVTPVQLLRFYCSIIAINPFYISTTGSTNGCGNWLAQPGCNAVLSNKNWKIQNASHSIQDGTYTTTFHLFLDMPSVDLVSGAALGGDGGTYVPANTACKPQI